ncbi:MAG: hypothetical protein MJ016_02560 [Victivallaceae bacterium]|nr:hypothetical protein [Victivallaceae bacterium]
MFDARKFRNPPAIHATGYFWWLNGKLDDGRIVAQLENMAALGVRSVCPHPMPPECNVTLMSEMAPKYLSKAFFQKIRLIADTCKRLKMSCYLYDEGGWPSGGACGQVYAADPKKFARKTLVPDGKGKYRIAVDAPDFARAPYVNLLTPGVTEKFIALTHEKYSAAVGDRFGKEFFFAFTDEPAAPHHRVGCLPYTDDLFAEFKKRKGYDVEPLVGAMLGFSARPEVVQALSDYSDVVSQLFVERYLRPLKNWCRKHHLKSGGHFNGEDEPENALFHFHGCNTLRALREMDFPGIDIIWRQIWPGVRLHPFPKFASSAANQTGNRFVSAEIGGVFGAGLTPAQLKFLVDYTALCGVNVIVIGVYPFSTSGGNMPGERPLFGASNPLWRHLKNFHEYSTRLSYLAALGKPAVANALFFDTATLTQKNIVPKYEEQELSAYRMLERQCDFDYADEDLLEKARWQKGKLHLGRAVYDRLVISPYAKMGKAAQKRLASLREQGAEIVSTERVAEIPPTLAVEPADWRIRVRKRILADGEALYMLFNASGESVSRSYRAAENFPVALCDAETGKLFLVPSGAGRWEWTLPPWGSAVFLVGKSAWDANALPEFPGKTVAAPEMKWRLRATRQIQVGAHDYEITDPVGAQEFTVSLGDWAEKLGDYFSGEAVYRTEFSGTAAKNAHFLDLGVVRYAAQVRLNGVNLGTRLYAPYCFPLGNALKKGKNLLEITVVNTLANAIASPAAQKIWEKLPFNNPYDARSRFFERESLPSGLFGPVTFRE